MPLVSDLDLENLSQCGSICLTQWASKLIGVQLVAGIILLDG